MTAVRQAQRPDRPAHEPIVRLSRRPIGLRAANAYVEAHHRHLDVATTGHKFSIAAVDPDGEVRGVIIAGRPVARMLDDGYGIEVLRLATDGTPNACSLLYAGVARAAKAMGYAPHRIITYTLNHEPGTSLLAAGWVRDGITDGGEWSRGSRLRKKAVNPEPKVRWLAGPKRVER